MNNITNSIECGPFVTTNTGYHAYTNSTPLNQCRGIQDYHVSWSDGYLHYYFGFLEINQFFSTIGSNEISGSFFPLQTFEGYLPFRLMIWLKKLIRFFMILVILTLINFSYTEWHKKSMKKRVKNTTKPDFNSKSMQEIINQIKKIDNKFDELGLDSILDSGDNNDELQKKKEFFEKNY